jgi:FMN-dependent NADH-azoreductase
MPTLLHVNSSPLGEASISRRLSTEFVQNWKEANRDGKVLTRDLTAGNIPVINADWIGASYTPKASRTPAQNKILAFSDSLIAELRAADEYIFGVPMHNFGPPSVLKLWIDQVVRAGETFAYSEAGPSGMLKGKKATFVVASGGVYDAGTAMASFDFVQPYLRTVFGFLGVTDTTFVTAGGTAALMSGKLDRQSFLQPHLDSIQALFQSV